MPNTAGQAELLFKISLGAADTGPNRAGGTKQFYEEALPSRPVVFSTSVWSDVDKIPLTAPTLPHLGSEGVVQYFENVPFLALEGQPNPDTGFALPDAKQAFYLPDLRDSIPFNFSPNGSYAYKIKKASGSNVAFGEGDWVLDVASGLLNFYGGLPDGVSLSDPPTISFYKYIGAKGGGGGGASIQISETPPTGVEPGAMWWNSVTGDLLLYYSDGDTSQWVSAIGGVGGLWTLSGNTITTQYNIAKAGGSFKISHPLSELNESHFLYHSFVEGPRADLIYRGEIQLVNGRATINIDEVSKMTNGTFEALSRNPSCFTTNETDWTPVRGKVNGNLLEIEAQDPNSTATVSWLVISERKDPAACNLEWTDSEGYASPEVLKESIKPDERPKLDPIILRTSL